MSDMRRWATISDCERFRYELGREWDPGLPASVFIMLNPSTADANTDDPTIRRCVNFARGWGSGSVVVVNLFAFRATDPMVLKKAIREGVHVGDGSAETTYIRVATERADRVVLAWGAHIGGAKMIGRAREVDHLFKDRRVWCLGTTLSGHPRHPLMVAAKTSLIAYGGVP